MGANLEIAGPVKRTEEGNVDFYYGGGGYAWSSKAAAIAGVPSTIRPGKVVGVVESGKVAEYIWHPDNTGDNGLVKVVTGDAGTVRTVTAELPIGSIKSGDQVQVGTNATNADLLAKLITAPAAPVYTPFTIYATSATINSLTAQTVNVLADTYTSVIKFVAESGGVKQSVWLSDDLPQPTSIEYYNPVSGTYSPINVIGKFSPAAETMSGKAGKRYTSTARARGETQIRIRRVSGAQLSNTWIDSDAWIDSETWID